MRRVNLVSQPTKVAEQQIAEQIDYQQLSHDLREAVDGFRGVSPWAGVFRFVSLGLVTICLTFFTWRASQVSLFLIGAIATSLTYAFLLICNHAATHRTLTGWDWFDTLMPRLISWPMLLPVGTYNQLHKLHHGQNGINLQDPERIQWTEQEYESAQRWQRWYVRHQWIVDIFVLGSVGLVFKTLMHGFKLQKHLHSASQQIRQQIILDVSGILIVQAILISLLIAHAVSIGKYLLFLFVLERGIGVVLQTRDHIEHYGLWQSKENYLLTQLYACRNIDTFAWVNWLMGGLPYHAIHHTFPQIASNRLPEAFQRVQAVLKRYSLPPMATGSGYNSTAATLSHQPCIIWGVP